MVRNEYSNRLYLTQSAEFLQDKNIGTFNVNRDIVISFKEAHNGSPGCLYINNPKYLKPDLSRIGGIEIVPKQTMAQTKFVDGQYISEIDYKYISLNNFLALSKGTNVWKVNNPNQIVTVHLAALQNSVYLSPTKKIEEGILFIEKGPEIRNMTEKISDAIFDISKDILKEFKLDTCSVSFETDNRSLRLIDVTSKYIPVQVKRLYEIVIPQLLVPKFAASDPLWLQRIKLRKIEDQVQEHRSQGF